MGTTTATLKAFLGERRNAAAVRATLASARRRRQGPQPPERADELAEMVLRDHDGEDARLGDLWRDRPAALVFLRHWG